MGWVLVLLVSRLPRPPGWLAAVRKGAARNPLVEPTDRPVSRAGLRLPYNRQGSQ